MKNFAGWSEILSQAAEGNLEAQRTVEKVMGLTEGGYGRLFKSFQAKNKLHKNLETEHMVELGLSYLEGIGSDKNPITAKYWLERAITKNENNPTALYHLGMIYYNEYNELVLAESLIEKAVKIGPIKDVSQEEANNVLQSIKDKLKE